MRMVPFYSRLLYMDSTTTRTPTAAAAAEASEFDLCSCMLHIHEAMLYCFVAAVVIPIVMIKNIWMRVAKGSIQYPTWKQSNENKIPYKKSRGLKHRT